MLPTGGWAVSAITPRGVCCVKCSCGLVPRPRALPLTSLGLCLLRVEWGGDTEPWWPRG